MNYRRYLYFTLRQTAISLSWMRRWHLTEFWHRLTAGRLRSVNASHAVQTGRGGAAPAMGLALHFASGREDREYWLAQLSRIASPVLENLAAGTLRRNMPVECPGGSRIERSQYSHLEALGRLLAGIAPWLELEGELSPVELDAKRRIAGLARRALESATDPDSPDFLNFGTGRQPLVDAAHLAQALLRAPRALCDGLTARARGNVIAALRASRQIRPVENNWVLFSAMVEAALKKLDGGWEHERVNYALRRHEEWYKGDGAYGDGPHFCWDYYNSFVIHPMLVDVMHAVAGENAEWDRLRAAIMRRAVRYAEVQERLISPEGTFPAVGRSLAYRTGTFHHLANMALLGRLPLSIVPAQVRCALTAVMQRSFGAPGTFDGEGWLTVGLAGHQPGLGEYYVSTGSLYACALVLLPLGLPPRDDFWNGAPAKWSSRRIWDGEDIGTDKALEA